MLAETVLQITSALIYYAAIIIIIRLLARWDLLIPTIGLYLISYTIAQYLSTKLTVFGLWAVPAGTISFVATMALLDIIVTKYRVAGKWPFEFRLE